MATLPAISSSFVPAGALTIHSQTPQLCPFKSPNRIPKTLPKAPLFQGSGCKASCRELPKVEPKFQAPFLGFTRTAEIWNSRACMIGLIGTFIVELILNKGILQVIGVDVGKGLDLPL